MTTRRSALFGLGLSLLVGPAMALAANSAPGNAKEIEIPADSRGPTFNALMWTPCAVTPLSRPGVAAHARDCEGSGKALPIIVISHGLAGSAVSHHDTAEALARAGFVVVAPTHPQDSAFDLPEANRIASFVERPTDIRRTIDYLVRYSPGGTKIDSRRIGFFGFSRGGYTGLVLAGGEPDFAMLAKLLAQQDVPGDPHAENDARISAFVIADPLNVFPSKDSLRNIVAPLQLWSSERGGMGATPAMVTAIAGDLPRRPDFHLVPNSVHLSFLAPCSQTAPKEPVVCDDPPGFDRTAFHTSFNTQVVAFFRKHLTE